MSKPTDKQPTADILKVLAAIHALEEHPAVIAYKRLKESVEQRHAD